MLQTLRQALTDKPDLYLSELAVLLWEDFGVEVSEVTIGRALKTMKWSKKINSKVAKQRNADLRDHCAFRLGEFHSWQLVFIDESNFTRLMGMRKRGWAPLGVAPMQMARHSRDYRYQILPAYAQDGIMLTRIYQDTTDHSIFEDFIEQLLHHCGRWPEPKSVLVMDNASIHHSDHLVQLCAEAGVKLVHLSPYSPDHNPIEMYFSVLKTVIKKHWPRYEEEEKKGRQDIEGYLEWCVEMVGSRADLARKQFEHTGITVEEF